MKTTFKKLTAMLSVAALTAGITVMPVSAADKPQWPEGVYYIDGVVTKTTGGAGLESDRSIQIAEAVDGFGLEAGTYTISFATDLNANVANIGGNNGYVVADEVTIDEDGTYYVEILGAEFEAGDQKNRNFAVTADEGSSVVANSYGNVLSNYVLIYNNWWDGGNCALKKYISADTISLSEGSHKITITGSTGSDGTRPYEDGAIFVAFRLIPAGEYVEPTPTPEPEPTATPEPDPTPEPLDNVFFVEDIKYTHQTDPVEVAFTVYDGQEEEAAQFGIKNGTHVKVIGGLQYGSGSSVSVTKDMNITEPGVYEFKVLGISQFDDANYSVNGVTCLKGTNAVGKHFQDREVYVYTTYVTLSEGEQTITITGADGYHGGTAPLFLGFRCDKYEVKGDLTRATLSGEFEGNEIAEGTDELTANDGTKITAWEGNVGDIASGVTLSKLTLTAKSENKTVEQSFDVTNITGGNVVFYVLADSNEIESMTYVLD